MAPDPLALAGSTAWFGEAPDPLNHPEFYEGVVSRRIVAHLVDLFVIALAIVCIDVVLVMLGVVTFGLVFIPLAFAGLGITLAYDALQVGGPRSATLGMRLMGLEVRSWTGARPLPLQALVRAILFWGMVYALNALTFWLVLGWALFNTRRRCLHDHLSGTVVVRVRRVMVLSPGLG